MTRYRLLLLTAAAMLATACAQAPTAPAAPGKARFDGGNTTGGGGAVPTDSANSASRGGNSLGSGN